MTESINTHGQPAHSKDELISKTDDTIWCSGYVTSYADLAERAAAVAATLAKLHVRAHDRVLIMLPDGPELIQACAGVGHRGAVPLPVDPLLVGTELTATATETGARLVLAHAYRIPDLVDLDADPVVVDQVQGLWAAVLR